MSKISKYMSLVLRHDPAKAGLVLDEGGWVALDDLVAGMCADGVSVTRDEVLEVVATSDKKRFTLNAEGTRIRAAQGHSVAVDLGLEPRQPPDELLHGTGAGNVAAILEQGLRPMSRQHVHLSMDRETALKVGMRHGKPQIFRVNTAAMYADDHLFWVSDNQVWLTDAVPPKYLTLME